MLQPHQIQLTNSLEKAIYEEAALLAKEKYNSNVAFALSVLYGKLRSIGDTTAAAVAFELIERMEDENYENELKQEIEWESAE